MIYVLDIPCVLEVFGLLGRTTTGDMARTWEEGEQEQPCTRLRRGGLRRGGKATEKKVVSM